MTQEKFITNIMQYLGYCDGATLDRINENFDEFFNSNVCISKGETLQARMRNEWGDIFTQSSFVEYRIKPPEPVYEWQWYRLTGGKVYFNSDKFYTDDEAKAWNNSEYKKFEETKKLRR